MIGPETREKTSYVIFLFYQDTYWNGEEFPRLSIRGSWDGFWWSFISMTTVG